MKAGEAKVYQGGELHWVGDGFPVRSIFGYNDLGQELSPFLLLDYAAPYNFPPSDEKRGVGGHPHRGFETVTIAYQGEIAHRDSSGGGGVIGPGDVQWMTAAKGLVHEEFHSEAFTKKGGMFEMVQLWVNLPAKDKNAEPGYQTILDRNIPRVKIAGGGNARIIAGQFEKIKGPAKTFTAINLWDLEIQKDGAVTLPLPKGHTKAAVVLRGDASTGEVRAEGGDLIVWDLADSNPSIRSSQGAKLLVLSGAPIPEPVVGYGPFVMNTKAEIKQAFEDFQMGKLGSLD